jgi:hypothetical protein
VVTKILATLAATAAILAVGAPAASALSPVTGAATAVSDHSALLHGKVSALASVIDVYFIYGTTTQYGSHTAVGSVLLSGTLAVGSKLSNLAPGTQYHYRFVTDDLIWTYYGADVAFTTVPDTSASVPTPSPPVSPPVDTTVPDPGTPVATIPSGDPPVGGKGGPPAGAGTSPILSVVQPTGDDSGASGDASGPASKPALGQSLVAATASGSVGVQSPGTGKFATLAGNAPVPVGSIIDARHGTVRLVTAVAGGNTQTGTFHGAVFQVKQKRGGGGMTDIVLRGGNFASCKSGARHGGAARVSAAGRPRVVRRLWGNDHHGRFRTRGSNSIATVRGTSWVTTDRCDGTLTSVSKGSVSVRDLHRKRTVLVRAGHSYLARGHH